MQTPLLRRPPPQVTEEDLAKYFGLLGEVNNVIMLRDKFTSRHKVRAFIPTLAPDVPH